MCIYQERLTIPHRIKLLSGSLLPDGVFGGLMGFFFLIFFFLSIFRRGILMVWMPRVPERLLSLAGGAVGSLPLGWVLVGVLVFLCDAPRDGNGALEEQPLRGFPAEPDQGREPEDRVHFVAQPLAGLGITRVAASKVAREFRMKSPIKFKWWRRWRRSSRRRR